MNELEQKILEIARELYKMDDVAMKVYAAGADNPDSMMVRKMQRQMDEIYTRLIVACKNAWGEPNASVETP